MKPDMIISNETRPYRGLAIDARACELSHDPRRRAYIASACGKVQLRLFAGTPI